MDNKSVKVLLLMLVCSLHGVWSQTTEDTTTEDTTTDIPEDSTTEIPQFSCYTYTGTELDLPALSGIWFETGRAPDVDDMQCVNVSVPAEVSQENKIDLNIEYVDTTNGKWEPAKDSGSFPWNEDTQNGIFNWHIGETTRLPVTYKLVSTDHTTYAFFCGYMGIAPVPLFKVWTRSRHLTAAEKTTIEQRFVEVGQGANLVWVEQSLDKCNSAMRSAGGALVALALGLLIYRRNI